MFSCRHGNLDFETRFTIGSGPATINGNTVTFNGVGQVVINYSVTSPDCGTTQTASRTFSTENCNLYTVSGAVWNDDNGNALQDPGETAIDNGLWANLVNPGGLVVSSVKIDSSGTYRLSVPSAVPGSYSVILTNTENYLDKPLSDADQPTGGFGYTGTNFNNNPDRSNRSGVLSIGELSASGRSNVTFGISNNPDVLPVSFGSITATIKKGSLLVKWTTLQERNNKKFMIEASGDGQHFVSIGEVKSVAAQGNSDRVLSYEWVKDVSALSLGAVSGGILLALLMSGLTCFRKGKRFLCLVVTVLICYLVACTRKDTMPGSTQRVLIRIVQEDIDGSRSFSKVISVAKEYVGIKGRYA